MTPIYLSFWEILKIARFQWESLRRLAWRCTNYRGKIALFVAEFCQPRSGKTIEQQDIRLFDESLLLEFISAELGHALALNGLPHTIRDTLLSSQLLLLLWDAFGSHEIRGINCHPASSKHGSDFETVPEGYLVLGDLVYEFSPPVTETAKSCDLLREIPKAVSDRVTATLCESNAWNDNCGHVIVHTTPDGSCVMITCHDLHSVRDHKRPCVWGGFGRILSGALELFVRSGCFQIPGLILRGKFNVLTDLNVRVPVFLAGGEGSIPIARSLHPDDPEKLAMPTYYHVDRRTQQNEPSGADGYSFGNTVNLLYRASYQGWHSIELSKSHGDVGMIGHVVYGKTTIATALIAVRNPHEPAAADKCLGFFKRELGGSSLRASQILPTHVEFETPDRSYLYVDCPGHADYVDIMNSGPALMDGITLIVSSTNGFMPQSFEQVRLDWQISAPLLVSAKEDTKVRYRVGHASESSIFGYERIDWLSIRHSSNHISIVMAGICVTLGGEFTISCSCHYNSFGHSNGNGVDNRHGKVSSSQTCTCKWLIERSISQLVQSDGFPVDLTSSSRAKQFVVWMTADIIAHVHLELLRSVAMGEVHYGNRSDRFTKADEISGMPPFMISDQAAGVGSVAAHALSAYSLWVPREIVLGVPGNRCICKSGRVWWLREFEVVSSGYDALEAICYRVIVHRYIKQEEAYLESCDGVIVAGFTLGRLRTGLAEERPGGIVEVFRNMHQSRARELDSRWQQQIVLSRCRNLKVERASCCFDVFFYSDVFEDPEYQVAVKHKSYYFTCSEYPSASWPRKLLTDLYGRSELTVDTKPVRTPSLVFEQICACVTSSIDKCVAIRGMIFTASGTRVGYLHELSIAGELLWVVDAEGDAGWKWVEHEWNLRMINKRHTPNNFGEYPIMGERFGHKWRQAMSDFIGRISDGGLCLLFIDMV